jgi:hypothetical protein
MICVTIYLVINVNKDQFCRYMEYVKGLSFEDEPNYNYCVNLFNDVLAGLGPGPDFDWVNTNRSSIVAEIIRKANTSLMLNNNNISKNSPLPNEGSGIEDDVGRNSIFKKWYY